MTLKSTPKVLAHSILTKTRIFTVEAIQLGFDNGNVVNFERLIGSENGAVLIIPMQDKDIVLLTREYAAGLGCYELALPKGAIDDNEDILEAANRELKEEVGYGARNLQVIKKLSTSPGYMKHSTYIVLAQDLYPCRLPGDEPEEIEVVPWRINDLTKLLQRDDCTDARSIAALYMLRDYITEANKSTRTNESEPK